MKKLWHYTKLGMFPVMLSIPVLAFIIYALQDPAGQAVLIVISTILLLKISFNLFISEIGK